MARAFLRCAQDRLCPCARPRWPCHNVRWAGADPRILGSAMSRRDTCWLRHALECGGLPPPSPPKLASAEGKREQAPALQSWRSRVAPTLVFMSATRRHCKSPQGADIEINVCASQPQQISTRVAHTCPTVVVGMYAPFRVVVALWHVEDPTMGVYIATTGVATYAPAANSSSHVCNIE